MSNEYEYYEYDEKELRKMGILAKEFCVKVGIKEDTLKVNIPIRVTSNDDCAWNGKTGRIQGFVRMDDGDVDLWFEQYHGDSFQKGTTVEILDSNFQTVIKTLNF